MNLKKLNRKEKAAILKTLITIAGADNRLSYSENTFLSMFLMEINEDKSFFNYLDNISSSETIEIIKNLGYNDKQDIVYLWLQMASKAIGNYEGSFCINDFPEVKNIIMSMANHCNIELDFNKRYTITDYICTGLQTYSEQKSNTKSSNDSQPKTTIHQSKQTPNRMNCSWEEYKKIKEAEERDKRIAEKQKELEEKRKAEEYRIAKERNEKLIQIQIEAGKIKEQIEKECSKACLTPYLIIMIILLLLSFAIPFMLVPTLIWTLVGGIWMIFKCYNDIDKKKQEWRDNHPNDPIGSYL